MSESLLSAIIGLIGAVLCGLIGAFGAIAAAEITRKARIATLGGCGVIGLVASVAAAIGLVLGLFFAAPIVQRLGLVTSQPTTVEQPSRPQQPSPTPVVIVVTATAPQPIVRAAIPTQQAIQVQATATNMVQVRPSPASTHVAGPFRNHQTTPTIGSGALAQGTYSDGLAPFSESYLASHLNIQRIRLEENPDGCGVAFLDADKVWFGTSQRTSITVNGIVVGEVYGPTGKHGYIFNLPIRKGDKICVTKFDASGFHIVFGPDIYYHHDSYCYRGNCY